MDQEANIKFIKQVKLRPCLYNKNLPSYSRKSVQDKSWEEIAKYMGWSVSQCKERWRNLRCVYIRHIKMMSKGEHKRPYYLMNVMKFAMPFMKPLNCDTFPQEVIDALQGDDDNEAANDDDDEDETQKSFEIQVKGHSESESPEHSISFAAEYLPSTSTQIKHENDGSTSDLNPSNDSRSWSRKRKTGFNEIDELSTHMDLNTDARKMFLYSLLPDIYAMTDAQMRQFKLKVVTIIGDIFDSQN